MIKQKVLFLCTANSSRTQIAEGFLRKIGGDHFEVVSAGGSLEELSPPAIEAMQEIGIDISKHQTKDVAKYLGESGCTLRRVGPATRSAGISRNLSKRTPEVHG